MGFDDFIGGFGNHTRGLAVLRVDWRVCWHVQEDKNVLDWTRQNAARTTCVPPQTRHNEHTTLTIRIEILNDLAELLPCLLVEVRDGDTSGEDGVVGMGCGEVGDGFGGEALRAI